MIYVTPSRIVSLLTIGILLFTLALYVGPALGAELHDAVTEGDRARIVELIRAGGDLEATDQEGATPLHYAAQKGLLEISTLLLDQGAQVDPRDANGFTPLHHAIMAGHASMVNLLVERGANTGIQNQQGISGLHIAVQFDRADIVNILLDQGAEPALRTTNHLTALMFGLLEGKDSSIVEPLNRAENLGRLTFHVPVTLTTDDLCVLAALDSIPDTGACWPSTGSEPLIMPLRSGVGSGNMRLASFSGLLKVDRLLVKSSFKVEENGLELSRGIIVYPRNSSENTVRARRIREIGLRGMTLVSAIMDDHPDLVDAMLERGDDPESPNSSGFTPIMAASQIGQATVVAKLLKRGANPNTVVSGTTSLMLAAYHGHDDIVNLLLRHGAEVDATNQFGYTPLMFAALNGHPSCAKILIVAGADTSLTNSKGEAALQIAEKQGHTAVAQVIRGQKP